MPSTHDQLSALIQQVAEAVSPDCEYLYGRRAATAIEAPHTLGPVRVMVDPFVDRPTGNPAILRVDVVMAFVRPLPEHADSAGAQLPDEQTVIGEMDALSRTFQRALDEYDSVELDIPEQPRTVLANLTAGRLFGMSLSFTLTASGLVNACNEDPVTLPDPPSAPPTYATEADLEALAERVTTLEEGSGGGGGGDGYLPTTGGTMSGNIAFNPAGQYIGAGTFDTERGGSGGISLVCSVGYEFNWQAGWLITTEQGSSIPRPLYLDGQAGTTLRVWNGISGQGVEVLATGIKFPDGSEQTTATPDLSGYATTAALTSGLGSKADTSHTHVIGDVTSLQTALNLKAVGIYALPASVSIGVTTAETLFVSVPLPALPAGTRLVIYYNMSGSATGTKLGRHRHGTGTASTGHALLRTSTMGNGVISFTGVPLEVSTRGTTTLLAPPAAQTAYGGSSTALQILTGYDFTAATTLSVWGVKALTTDTLILESMTILAIYPPS